MTCDLVQNPGCDVETTEDKDKIDFLSEWTEVVKGAAWRPRDTETPKTSRTTSSTVAVISRIGIQMRGVAKGVAWLSGCRNFQGRIQDWNSNQNYISGERNCLMSGPKKLPRPRIASRTVSDVSRIGIQMTGVK
ncbi:unnamed protein product [Caenorhabditis nigoni]